MDDSRITNHPCVNTPAGVPCWNIHHRTLLEWSIEPVINRLRYIVEYKPKDEIEARLRSLRVVKGELPTEVLKAKTAYDKAGTAYENARTAYYKAWTACDNARTAYDKAWTACDNAWTAYDKAGTAYENARTAYDKACSSHRNEIEALHRKECPDSAWDYEKGTLVFSEKETK